MILQQYLNRALNRFGGNNKMLQDIDMNNNHILNLPVPGGDQEPLRKGDITSSLTGATVQYVDDTIVDVNSPSYFATLQEAIDSTNPLRIYLGGFITLGNRAGASFQIVTLVSLGGGTLNGADKINLIGFSLWALDLADDVGLVNMGCVLDGVTDSDSFFMAAIARSVADGKPIVETAVGTLKYSTPADFSANGAGLIWGGISKCTLLYGGIAHSDGVRVDNGGVHRIYTVTGQTGTFEYGETIVGQTTGRKGTCRQRFSSHPLEIYALGAIPDIETIIGDTSGATAQVTVIGDADIYGSTLQDIKIRGFTIRADRTQSLDGGNNPLDWFEGTGIYKFIQGWL